MKEVITSATVNRASEAAMRLVNQELMHQSLSLDSNNVWQGHTLPGINLQLDDITLTNIKFIVLVDWCNVDVENDDTDMMIEYVRYEA